MLTIQTGQLMVRGLAPLRPDSLVGYSVHLKLYIYGYLYRVQSSRRLEGECHRNLEVMWLLGRLAPDHKTIADFRKDNGAAGVRAIRRVVPVFGIAVESQRCH
jgi:transposase